METFRFGDITYATLEDVDGTLIYWVCDDGVWATMT